MVRYGARSTVRYGTVEGGNVRYGTVEGGPSTAAWRTLTGPTLSEFILSEFISSEFISMVNSVMTPADLEVEEFGGRGPLDPRPRDERRTWSPQSEAEREAQFLLRLCAESSAVPRGLGWIAVLPGWRNRRPGSRSPPPERDADLEEEDEERGPAAG